MYRRQGCRPVPGLVYLVTMLLLLGQTPQLAAATVVFLYDGDNSHHLRYVEEGGARLRETLPQLELQRIELDQPEQFPLPATGDVLLVSVGTAAARKAAEYHLPTLNTLITRRTYLSLSALYRSPRSAVYLEQSIERQLQLLRVALPARKKITLLARDASTIEEELRTQFRKAALALRIIEVKDDGAIDQLFGQQLLSDDTLLLLPDPLLVNRQTVKPLVLGSYRQGIPLIGYSQALVKAGALMAVHSSLSALEKQMAMAVSEFLNDGTLPSPQYSKQFSVSVNYQLARALQLSLPAEDVLARRMREMQQ